ncbi:phage/conjugal plasmid C-4 type zinc finger TraR family protein [Bradyrhizobium sp. USDA 4341]
MADDVDMAQGHAERYLESAIRGISKTLTGDPGAPVATECEECGSDIAEARLKALPATRHCFDCASAMERGRKLRR